MPTIFDDPLSHIAPNIIVSVGTPPVFTPSVVPGSGVPQVSKIIVDIASRGVDAIVKDETKNLVGLARRGELLHYHIKFYSNPGKTFASGTTTTTTTTTTTAPPVLPPPTSPPPPPTKFSTTDASKLIPDVSEAPDFETIKYIPEDLVGVKPPDNTKFVLSPPSVPGEPALPPPPGPAPVPKNGTSWSPLELSSLPYFEDFPSAIYIPVIQSCISAPYFAPEAKRHLNGVQGSARNPSPGKTCYLWEVDRSGKDRQFPAMRARPDGAIVLDSQRRDMKNPYADVYIEPGKWESKFGLKNGDSLNAFSLILGIQYGGRENQPSPAIWSIEIIFGDMTLKIFEGGGGISVFNKADGSNPTVPEKIAIKPSTVPYITDHFGERPYLLTFIPVWNGVLMSYGVPASSDWGNTITFLPKDRSLSANAQLTEILNVEQTKKEKEDGVNPYPPKITVTRDKKKYKAPGVFMRGKKIAQVGKKGDKNYQAQSISNSDFNMGKKLILRFHRCGGTFKFVPVWFTPYSKYHYLYAGAADPGDVPKVKDEAPERRPPGKPKRDSTGAVSGKGPRKPPPLPPGVAGPPAPAPKTPPAPKDDPSTVPSEPDVFKVKSKTTQVVMPILNFSSDPIDFRTNLVTIVKSASKPFACLSMEFRNVQPDVRRPIQVWGAVLSQDASLIEHEALFPPSTDEGFLTVNDMPEPRIRRFSISRGLDGANGEITWDRNDPVSGLLQRPSQRIGSIRVGLSGGANILPDISSNPGTNTTSGIVFTGIAMGNSQEDSPDENTVRVPLRGREAKLDSDGGICLWNCPVFDGWDHKDAMRFLANYGGVPINTDLATDFQLIFAADIQNPILFIMSGTGVNQAMDVVTKESCSAYFFDRFGTLIHFDSETSSGNNWNYPDIKLESFSDEPDFQWMRNEIVVLAQVSTPGSPGAQAQVQPLNNMTSITPTTAGTVQIPNEVVMVKIPITTIPKFPWARQIVYQIPQIIQSRAEVIRLALRFAEARGRPRATARCQIPPNANIELLDTLNDNWIITSISHEADTQTKRWTMSLGVELFVSGEDTVGEPLAKYFTEQA